MSDHGLLKPHGQAINVAVRFLDLGVLALAGWVAYWLRFAEWSLPSAYFSCLLGGILLAALIMPLGGLYQSWRGVRPGRISAHAVVAWGMTFGALLILIWAAHWGEYYSRLWLGTWGVLGAIGLGVVRLGAYFALACARRRGLNVRRVLLFGAGDLGRRVLAAIEDHGWTGYQVVALLDDDPSKEGGQLGGLRIDTGTDRIENVIRERAIDEVWLALPLKAEDRVHSILHELRHSTVNIRMMPDLFGLRLLNHSLTDIAGIGTVNLSETPLHGWNRVLKAVEDRVLGATIFLLAAPVMAVIALAIRVTMGKPVLFRQQRHGWDGQTITVYKFRTMLADACAKGVTQACRNDPRVTRLGAFLRRTSLDELPQLWNVLNGTMSLVGPRPHATEHNVYYMEEIDRYMKRHCVKPGITGWAQVNGLRGETETLEKMAKRVEYDLFYIENWSPKFDLEILGRTLYSVTTRRNAY